MVTRSNFKIVKNNRSLTRFAGISFLNTTEKNLTYKIRLSEDYHSLRYRYNYSYEIIKTKHILIWHTEVVNQSSIFIFENLINFWIFIDILIDILNLLNEKKINHWF